MPFDKVETQVDFPAQERAILDFWQSHDTFELLRAKNMGGPRWSFLDGPITANNPMGVHHAWGRTYKDAFQRYHAMLGEELRYQNGFDCQGLWVEVEVEKELGLRSKRDIENLVPGDRFKSIDEFVRLCKARVDKFARIQTEQSIRLGYWMDWDRDEDWACPPDLRRSYFTMSEENNYTIWSFLKKCHQRGLIYRGYDAMPWCPRCAVGLAEMEVKEGYQTVVHRAVFVKFPLRGRPGENLLVWTTTPWTLTSNVGAAVNPYLTYLRVKLRGEVYYVARAAFKDTRSVEEEDEEGAPGKPKGKKYWPAGVPRLRTIEQLFKEKGKEGFEVLGELKGAEMVGWAYDGPFDEFEAQGHVSGYPKQLAEVVHRQKWASPVAARAAHRVVAWDEVGETEGTGIVHIAPGCGREDFELGKEQGLPPVAPLDESGVYLSGFGELSGKSAGDHATTDWVLNSLQQKGLLFATEKYPHRYPHCWRCKTELLYRLVDEWFISMSWREDIMKICEGPRWIPEDGKKRELDWLKNMDDWMISKKRFWGLALPIWVDEVTGEFEVIGSREELRARAVEGWDKFEGHSPHRPWVDLVKIRNPKTHNLMSRIPDVGNPWLDAGIVPYSTMGYNTDRDYWEKWFPAELITESFPGQFRNWFYALLAMSAMMEGRAPFKVLLGHATVHDQYGKPMSKSAGNSIPFDGAADTGYSLTNERGIVENHPAMSADLIRWLYCRHNPVNNVNFGPGPAEEVRRQFTLKLWNTYAFFCNYARLDDFDPRAPQVPMAQRTDLDRWILSDLQKLVARARESFEKYDLMSFCLEAERFVDNKLSNWYVRRNRRRFWKSEREADKLAAYQTLYTVLVTLAKLFAPIMPFLSEEMYQNLVVRGAGGKLESVHLCAYPVPDEALIDEDLSADMKALLGEISLGSAARNSVKIKVRQPLAELVIQPGDDRDRRAVERFADQIRDELNVKRVTLHDPAAGPLLTLGAKPNMRALGPKFGARLNDAVATIASANPAELAALVEKGEPFVLPSPGGPVELEPGDVLVQQKAPEGWAGAVDGKTQVLLATCITEELAREGMARDVVRQVQELRKQAGLEMEDRIVLRLDTDADPLRQAIEAHREYIAAETLTEKWATQPLNEEGKSACVKVEKHDLCIELAKLTKT
jgi:isoleucyl-tRNA synthetase